MKVTIVQRVLPEYRVALFDEIQRTLNSSGIDFLLLYGQEMTGTTPVTINMQRSWAHCYKNLYLKLGKFTLVLQLNIFIKIIQSDLVIVEQANSLLLNYFLFLLRPIFNYKIAYWGHGYNHQAQNLHSFSEKIKLYFLKKSDWWFSYTKGTTDYLTAQGIALRKITTLRNTFDTRRFVNDLTTISNDQIIDFTQRHCMTAGQTALYCGGLVKTKEIDFLLKSALLIKKQLPGFSLLLVGSGPEQPLVEKYAMAHHWIIQLGSVYGTEKALAFKSVDCILMPGLVGLVAIDSIVAEKPIVIRELEFHGPEIDYIKEYKTGISTSLSIDDYSQAVVALLTDHKKKGDIIDNCKKHKQTFYIEHMANSFCSGIKQCIYNNA